MTTSLYRAVWRWHFYAGLIILPVLVWLAATGAIYLYKPELERRLYAPLIELPAGIRPSPIRDLVQAVELQTQGRVTQVARPAAATDSWRFAVSTSEGDRLAFVRPDTGLVLGTTEAGGPLDVVKRLHSLTVAGTLGNVLVEIVAGWAIVLVLTGFVLWWPRGANRALSLAGRVGERRFWRNLHASVGAVVGAVILFLAVTGMPWTVFWGARFHAFVAEQKIGRPAAPRGTAGAHDEHLPWSMRGALQPAIDGHGDVGPDAVIRSAVAHGLQAPWVLDLPGATGKPYRIAPLITHAEQARVLYLEPASGRVLQNDRWSDFGPGARAFEWGIYTHQGQQYGELNRLIMLAGCIGVWLLALSAPVLWWKRRLAPPSRPAEPRPVRGVAVVMLLVGALFPLTGLTMLVALGGEMLAGRRTRPALA